MPPSKSPDVFAYLDYRRFLADWFEARKAQNRRYSHRLFARQAGQKSPSLLLNVIRGKRNLTDATVEAFCQAMKLPAEEARFFAELVRLEQAGGAVERNEAWATVSASRRFRKARPVDSAAFDYLSHWYVVAIRELALRGDFVADPRWVAEALRPKISTSEARKALDTLLKLGLLVKQEDGEIVASDATVVTPHEVAGLAARNYHAGMLGLAKESIERFGPETRHLGAVTACVSESLIPRLKKEIAAFQERLLDICDSSEAEPERVMQFHMALFPLTDLSKIETRTEG